MARRPTAPETGRVIYLGRKVDARSLKALPGEFTYAVGVPVPGPRPPAPQPAGPRSSVPSVGGNRRAAGRIRTRLRSGAVVDAAGQVLADCLIHDRSGSGARLRLTEDRPLPLAFLLLDRVSGTMLGAEFVWRRGRDVGVRLAPRFAPPRGGRTKGP